MVRRLFPRAGRLAAAALLIAPAALGVAACNELAGIHAGKPRGSTGGGGTSSSGGSGGAAGCGDPSAKVDKVDVLLAIDNSLSMSDKQAILALAVPDLVGGLANPPCVDPSTGEVKSIPPGPLAKCLDGSQREFEPALDIHIGVVSSSLGGRGSDSCSLDGAVGNPTNDDKGHLLDRKDPNMPAATVETYQGEHFLAWDPAQKLVPPGEADLDADSAADANQTALVPSLREMILGVGQIGCGYEAQLESWYRFLADPAPYDSVSHDANDDLQLEGTDEALLAERKAFLRPDSMLAVVLLSDENDCSLRVEGKNWLALQQRDPKSGMVAYHLPRARAVCDQDPNNECCFPCGQTGPLDAGGKPKCAEDPSCTDAKGMTVLLDDTSDPNLLRCYDQKRRFGVDFLQPIDRYVNGLTSCSLPDRTGQIVPNPIFSDLDPSDGLPATRDASLVFLTAIVGVPWQDIARTDSKGAPDLKTGLDADGKPRGGFKGPAEMSLPLPGKIFNTWDVILGDPTGYPAESSLPKDPLMLESIDPRKGTDPVTGSALTPPSQPLGNPINGNEFTISGRNDLQYACIFPLVKVDDMGNITPEVKDCSKPMGTYYFCDCPDPNNDSPLCQKNPSSGKRTDQVNAKAYPGIRELQVLRGLGSQGAVASICPAQLTKPADPDFGYRPAIRTIIDRWKARH
jgi:hypothetical protein